MPLLCPRPGGWRGFPRVLADQGEVPKSGGDEDAAELGCHVGGGRRGLCLVPGAGGGVPGHGDLNAPSRGIALDDLRRGRVQVGGDQGQVVAGGGLVANEDHADVAGAEDGVPQAGDHGGADSFPLAVAGDGDLRERGCDGECGQGRQAVAADAGPAPRAGTRPAAARAGPRPSGARCHRPRRGPAPRPGPADAPPCGPPPGPARPGPSGPGEEPVRPVMAPQPGKARPGQHPAHRPPPGWATNPQASPTSGVIPPTCLSPGYPQRW